LERKEDSSPRLAESNLCGVQNKPGAGLVFVVKLRWYNTYNIFLKWLQPGFQRGEEGARPKMLKHHQKLAANMIATFLLLSYIVVSIYFIITRPPSMPPAISFIIVIFIEIYLIIVLWQRYFQKEKKRK
jgi:hypothetical protein